MSLPIAFTDTPYASGPDPADAEVTYEEVAQATDTNFERINVYLRSSGYVLATSQQTTALTAPLATHAWTAFPSAHWAPISLVLPARCSGLMVGCGARLYEEPSQPGWLGLSFGVTGATSYTGGYGYHHLLCESQWYAGSVGDTILASELVGGGTVTITPYYYWESDNASPGAAAQLYNGQLWAIALT